MSEVKAHHKNLACIKEASEATDKKDADNTDELNVETLASKSE
jgi:hypothetical protein